jgi:hypothetical protein
MLFSYSVTTMQYLLFKYLSYLIIMKSGNVRVPSLNLFLEA